MPPLTFEQIVKRSTKPLNPPPKKTPVPQEPPLSKRERRVIQLFRAISEYEKRTALAMLKMMARHTDGPTTSSSTVHQQPRL